MVAPMRPHHRSGNGEWGPLRVKMLLVASRCGGGMVRAAGVTGTRNVAARVAKRVYRITGIASRRRRKVSGSGTVNGDNISMVNGAAGR